jgi:putative DNA primase/helicase
MIRSSVENPCPVCDRTKDKDCSWYPDKTTVMCKTYSDGAGHDESKWYYNGINKLGFQGIFVGKQVQPDFVKSPRSKGSKSYEYPNRNGYQMIRVNRIDHGDGKKDFYQQHWNGSKWVNGNPDDVKRLIPIYRYPEVKQAIERNELIFVVEGETTADALWTLGIAATTTIGGSGGYERYGDYIDDLKDARLVLCPDRDAMGLKYMSNFDRDFCTQVEGWYLAGTAGMWKTPQGGMDIGDDITDNSYTKEQILDRVVASSPKDSENNKSTHFATSINGGLVKVSFKDDEDGNRKKSIESIGNHLSAIACVDNPEQDGASLLLEFTTYKGDIRRWTMLRAFLAGEGSSIAEGLLSRGYYFKRKQKGELLDYIQGLGAYVQKTYTVTDSSGWVGKSFVLPHKTYGDENLKFRDVDPSPEAITETKGTLVDWMDNVASRCAGNSRLILGLGTSFAAPLLPIVDIESGGFHLVGETSKGKTTILSVAASVTGVKNIPHWRTTTNGLESTATAFNHLCLPLDEIVQADPKDVGNIAYMLANGQGKARMKRDLTNRKGKTWRLIVLSSGEVGLGTYMAQANITQKGGQEVRLPDIPAVPEGSTYGCFETIHGADTAVQFVSALDAAVKENHGTALDAFLSRLVVDITDPSFAGNLSKQVHLVAAKLSEGTIDSAIGRVAKRFALVQVSLGLAHKYGLLPFPIEQIDWAISNCFAAWLKSRGGDGSIEIKQAIEKIEHLLVTNEFSDRVFTLPANSDRPVRNLLGYRKVDQEGQTEEFWVPLSVFNKEFCDGVNKFELVKELQRIGWLLPPRKDGKSTHQRWMNRKAKYYFVFGIRVFGGEGCEGSEGCPSNPDGEMISTFTHNLHYPKNSSEGCEGSMEVTKDYLHNLHHEKNSGEGSLSSCNAYAANTLASPSQPSQPSPLKTRVGNFISKNSENPALKYQRLLNGNIGTTVVKFEKLALAKDWKKLIAVVFGFYGELKQITDEQSDKYKWKLVFDKFDRDGIDRLQTKDFSKPPQPRS